MLRTVLFHRFFMLALFCCFLMACSSTKIAREKPGIPPEAQLAQLDRELLERCHREDLKPLFLKTACRANDITPEQLTDGTTISENEKTILLKSRLEHIPLLEKRHELVQAFGEPEEKELESLLYQAENQTDKYILELFESKITWGEYNSFRKDIFKSYREQMNRVLEAK